jgi:peptide/nickel transport system permease protein
MASLPTIDLLAIRSPKAGFQTGRLSKFVLGAAILALLIVVLAAAFPHLLSGTDPYDIDPANAFSPPSLEHWFGTDQNGRDSYSRVVYGARLSLFVGVLAIGIALLLGGLLGIGAALGGKWIDLAICRLIDTLFAFPGLILALVFIAILGISAPTVAIAVGIGSAAGYARIIRTQARLVIGAEYIQAIYALGHSPLRVLRRNIVPNICRPLLPLFTLGVGQTIVWATGLSFIGLGVRPPSAEWGALLSDSRNYVANAWWLTVFPGATIAITALALTVIGKHLQSRLDGRQS